MSSFRQESTAEVGAPAETAFLASRYRLWRWKSAYGVRFRDARDPAPAGAVAPGRRASCPPRRMYSRFASPRGMVPIANRRGWAMWGTRTVRLSGREPAAQCPAYAASQVSGYRELWVSSGNSTKPTSNPFIPCNDFANSARLVTMLFSGVVGGGGGILCCFPKRSSSGVEPASRPPVVMSKRRGASAIPCVRSAGNSFCSWS